MSEKKKRLPYKEYREQAEPSWLRRLRRIFFFVFIFLLISLVLTLIIGGKIFLDYSEDSFAAFERSQISYVEEDVLQKLNSASPEELLQLLPSELPDSLEFDDAEAARLKNYAELAEKDLTATEVRNTENENRKYAVYAGEEAVGFYELECTANETRLSMLSCETWEYAGGEAFMTYERHSCSVSLPEGFTVYLNGIAVSEDYLTGECTEIDRLRRIEEFEAMPRMVRYEVSDLLEEPEIKILNNLGQEAEFDHDAEEICLPECWAHSELPAEMENWIIEASKLWSEYCLLDRDLSEVQTILIPDSTLWNEVLLSDHDRWYIDAHKITGYEHERVSEYTVYSEDCFSCRVSMDRHILSTTINQDVPDQIDDVLFFIRRDLTDNGVDDPNWYLADIYSA